MLRSIPSRAIRLLSIVAGFWKNGRVGLNYKLGRRRFIVEGLHFSHGVRAQSLVPPHAPTTVAALRVDRHGGVRCKLPACAFSTEATHLDPRRISSRVVHTCHVQRSADGHARSSWLASCLLLLFSPRA